MCETKSSSSEEPHRNGSVLASTVSRIQESIQRSRDVDDLTGASLEMIDTRRKIRSTFPLQNISQALGDWARIRVYSHV